jgi:hypothetical protein
MSTRAFAQLMAGRDSGISLLKGLKRGQRDIQKDQVNAAPFVRRHKIIVALDASDRTSDSLGSRAGRHAGSLGQPPSAECGAAISLLISSFLRK